MSCESKNLISLVTSSRKLLRCKSWVFSNLINIVITLFSKMYIEEATTKCYVRKPDISIYKSWFHQPTNFMNLAETLKAHGILFIIEVIVFLMDDYIYPPPPSSPLLLKLCWPIHYSVGLNNIVESIFQHVCFWYLILDPHPTTHKYRCPLR